MRLWIVSDQHVNHYPWVPSRVPEHDIMIVAGDISDNGGQSLRELHKLQRLTGRPIIFVPGNHDVFDGPVDGFSPQLSGPVYVLPAGQSIIIDHVRFVGATLWTDFALAGDVYGSEAWAARHMPEYQHAIGPDGGRLWPVHTSAAHAGHRARIEALLATLHDGPSVVVTHHAPSAKSIKGPLDAASAAFASDLEPVIRQHQPALWVHGHIHTHSDYRIENTRILANPRGYEGADWFEDSGFIEDLVVDV